MTYNDIIDMEIKYVSMFAKIEKNKFGYISYDVLQRDKYYHNYFHVLDFNKMTRDDIVLYQTRYQDNGHVHFRFEQQPDHLHDALISYQKTINGYYLAHIDEVMITHDDGITIKKIDASIKQPFCHYLYLENREYGEQFSINNAIRQWDVLMKEPQYRYFYALVAGQIVGSINATWQQSFAKIDDFTVLEHYRHRGIGSSLMAHAISFLKTQGIKFVYLVTDMNDTPRLMYEKWGYRYLSSCYHYIQVFPNSSKT